MFFHIWLKQTQRILTEYLTLFLWRNKFSKQNTYSYKSLQKIWTLEFEVKTGSSREISNYAKNCFFKSLDGQLTWHFQLREKMFFQELPLKKISLSVKHNSVCCLIFAQNDTWKKFGVMWEVLRNLKNLKKKVEAEKF